MNSRDFRKITKIINPNVDKNDKVALILFVLINITLLCSIWFMHKTISIKLLLTTLVLIVNFILVGNRQVEFI